MKHLSSLELERIRRGAASAEETESVGRHVAECPECAALAGLGLSIGESVAAFQAAFAAEDERPPRRVFRGWKAVAPLAAAAAIAGIVFFFPRSPETPQPAPHHLQPPPHVTIAVARNAEWDALLAETRRSGVLPFPAEIRELAATDSFRGDSRKSASEQVWPAATAVDEQQPELRWPLPRGAKSIVTITLHGEEIERSGELTAARWRVPVALPRGEMVRWQVRIEKGEQSFVLPAPPAPPAIFRVLSAREHEELLRARSEAGGDHLLLGLLYARAGLVDDARRELETHARETQEPLAERLLRQLP